MTLAFGSATAGQTHPQVKAGDPPLVVDAAVVLEHQLAAPGSSFASPFVADVTIVGTLDLNVGTPTYEDAAAAASGDVSIRLTNWTLSEPGVSCSSDSGVFLSEPVPLPGLSTWGLVAITLLLGAAGVWLLGRRTTPATLG